jgi:aerobic carbon-monoxide dehydrogenase medium subunit
MSLPPFDYVAPETADEVVETLSQYGDDAILMAGGLTVMILLQERLVRPQVVVSLEKVPGLHSIEVNGAAQVGAMTTHSNVVNSAALGKFAPLLCRACGRVGSPAIRNMGTVGGSISQGDGASDVAPAFLAMDAEALVMGPDGTRTIPLDSFFKGVFTTALGEREFLTALRIPKPATGTRANFVKYTCTSAEAFAAVTVALSVLPGPDGICEDVRIGLGSVAPVPMRAKVAEDMLRSNKASPQLIAAAAEAAAVATDPSSDGQGSADYKREMTRVWVRRLLEDTLLQ